MFIKKEFKLLLKILSIVTVIIIIAFFFTKDNVKSSSSGVFSGNFNKQNSNTLHQSLTWKDSFNFSQTSNISKKKESSKEANRFKKFELK